MYKLYNFEAAFLIFLKTQKLPRIGQKRYLVFFRSFINWLTLTLQKTNDLEDIHSFLTLLSPDYLTKYAKFLSRWKTPKSSLVVRIEILRDFKSFLEKNYDLKIRSLKNPEKIFQEAIVEEFLSELKDQGTQDVTIRNYRSDISQFFYFLGK